MSRVNEKRQLYNHIKFIPYNEFSKVYEANRGNVTQLSEELIKLKNKYIYESK